MSSFEGKTALSKGAWPSRHIFSGQEGKCRGLLSTSRSALAALTGSRAAASVRSTASAGLAPHCLAGRPLCQEGAANARHHRALRPFLPAAGRASASGACRWGLVSPWLLPAFGGCGEVVTVRTPRGPRGAAALQGFQQQVGVEALCLAQTVPRSPDSGCLFSRLWIKAHISEGEGVPLPWTRAPVKLRLQTRPVGPVHRERQASVLWGGI